MEQPSVKRRKEYGYRLGFWAVNGLAGLLHVFIFFKADAEVADIGFSLSLLALSITPYLISIAFFMNTSASVGAMIGVCGALALDSQAYYDAFIAPTSGAATIGLFITPIVNILFVSVCCVLSRHLARVFRT